VFGFHPRVTSVSGIERENGTQQTYDPRRLSGVAVYHEVQREFSEGDRIQFTAPSREASGCEPTIERLSNAGNLEIRLDSGREIRFSISEHPHLDHGYAVTSHSSQRQTADRVLIHVDKTQANYWSTTVSRTYLFRARNTMPGFTRMTEASFPMASVVTTPNVQQPRLKRNNHILGFRSLLGSETAGRISRILREICDQTGLISNSLLPSVQRG
jgi:hypothetical protein